MCRLLATIAVTVLLVGCGDSGPVIVPVSGRVTLNGKGLANASVTFQPIDAKDNAPGSGAFTDVDGRYTLKIIGKETEGAVVGKHKVRINMVPQATDPSDDRPQRSNKSLPPKYSGTNTELEIDVPAGGTDSANFNLKLNP
jgi:hypothetical protein